MRRTLKMLVKVRAWPLCLRFAVDLTVWSRGHVNDINIVEIDVRHSND